MTSIKTCSAGRLKAIDEAGAALGQIGTAAAVVLNNVTAEQGSTAAGSQDGVALHFSPGTSAANWYIHAETLAKVTAVGSTLPPLPNQRNESFLWP